MKRFVLSLSVALFTCAVVGCAASSTGTSYEEEPGDTGGTQVLPDGGKSGGAGTGGAKATGGGTGTGGAKGTGGYSAYGGSSGSGGSTGSGGGSTGSGGGSTGSGGSLPGGAWTNATSNLANMASECGNLGFVSAKPDMDMLITGVAQKGLFSSVDGGATWTALGTGAGSDTITNRPIMVVYDPVTPTTWWEAGIYNGRGVYKTTDNGVTLKALGTIGHNDSVSIDFSDPSRKTLLAGGHESSQRLWKSTDGGASWTDIGPSLPGGTSYSSNSIIWDAQTYLVGCSPFATNGVYRTTNGGTSFTAASTEGPSGAPFVASDGAAYWGIIWNNGLLKSTDKGVTWTKPVGQWNVLQPIPLVELPDKRLAGVSGTGNNVDSFIVLSKDGGKTWTKIGPKIPFAAVSFTYSTFRKAFYVSYFSCSNNVPNNAIMSMAFDYTTN